MQLRLEPITSDNWRKAIKLNVDESQRSFVAPNYYSIIEAMFEPEHLFAYAVYDGDEMVGFTMHGSDPTDPENRYWIIRLMVDQKFQRRGYGRAIMENVIGTLKQTLDRDALYISFEPENAVARALYSSLGFQDTGLVMWEETVFKLPLKQEIAG
jgi:diamine N-acetyltransferase